jgi:hypothetical protein
MDFPNEFNLEIEIMTFDKSNGHIHNGKWGTYISL